MDDSRIPWWLGLLIGICVIGLAVWQSERWKLQVRLGAIGLALIYLGLLAYAIGGDPRPTATARVWRPAELLSITLCGVSLASAVLLIGRPPFRGQLIWFGLMSLANAGIAFVHAASHIVTAALALPVIVVAILLVQELRHAAPLRAADLWPPPSANPNEESPFQPWLVAVTGALMAVLLIGTSHYALHAESTRPTPSRRHSALPARSRIRRVLTIQPEQDRSAAVTDLFAGPRADLIVLVGVLAFITFTAATSRRVTVD